MPPEAKSFKQLTISVEKLPASMAQHEARTQHAAERARLLLGCYRTGDANDPETYVAAVTAVLARYREDIVTQVTHPATGLPSKKSWLPTVKEVREACEAIAEPIREEEWREKRIAEQLAERESGHVMPRQARPSLDELRAKYGKDWGIAPIRPDKSLEQRWEEGRPEMERAKARVDAEYEAAGMAKPSKFALSLTARRELAERDALREHSAPEGK